MKRLPSLVAVLAALAVASTASIAPAMAAPSPLLMSRLLNHPDTGKRPFMGTTFKRVEAVRQFYEARDYRAVWDRKKLEQLSFAFMAARQAGIDVSPYHLQALGREYTNDNELAIELLATDAWIALAEAMLGPQDAEGTDMLAYFEHSMDNGRIYEGLAELAAFRAGR